MRHGLKPFAATQRVRRPPGKGAARQPEASLAWSPVTAVVKRRQRAMKRRGSPDIMIAMAPSVCWARGQHSAVRYGEAGRSRPGSWTVAKSQEGLPGNLRDPARAHRDSAGDFGAPAEQDAPGLATVLPVAGSASANTKMQGPVEPEGENNEPTAMRGGKS